MQIPQTSDREAGHSRSIWLLVLIAIAGLVALALWNGGDETVVRGGLDLVARAREHGDFERAREFAARYRTEWVDAEDDRLQRLDREESRIGETEAACAAIEDEVLDPSSGGYAAWIERLRGIEAEGDPVRGVAARLVRSKLRETLNRRKPAAVARTPVGESNSEEASRVAPHREAVPEAADGAAERDPVAALFGDADRLAGEGLYAQAMSLLRGELGRLPDAESVKEVQAHLTALRDRALAAAEERVREARAMADEGEPGKAVTHLVLAEHRFPADGPFRILGEACSEFERAAAARRNAVLAPSAVTPRPVAVPGSDSAKSSETAERTTLPALREKLGQIRQAEAEGDWGGAAAALREAVALARSRDANFAAGLEERAERAGWRAALHRAVAEATADGRRLRTALRSGGEVVLVGVDGPRLLLDGDTRAVGWADLSAEGVAELVDQTGVAGPAALGAVGLIYDAGDAGLAEDVLARLLREKKVAKPDADRVIAGGRGEVGDGGGYVLGESGFVSQRAIDLREEAVAVARGIPGAFRSKKKGARDEFVRKLLAGPPERFEVVRMAFEQDLREQIARLEKSSVRRDVDRIEAHRVSLEKARDHARSLIYDEVTYFYPYKPPAVSAERFAEYNRVQAEVNRRIDALRGVWSDMRTRFKVPSSLRGDLDRLDWDLSVLRDVGGVDPALVSEIEWVRALPPGKEVTIRTYCRTVTEREELEEWERIEAYNRIVGRDLSSSVRELLRITNDYRTMYHHRPLAVSPAICRAAQGHADEMSRLGYFAHFSPTPGRRTPTDRMRLAGYRFGVSENIATHGSALGAHNAWLRSSGHHRNLLMPSHREMGIGADGRNWVENFGTGRTYEETEAWDEAGRRGRRSARKNGRR